MPPLVSVVVPTYNRPERLQRSVKSLLSQTYRPLEIIIVDDFSETPAAEVIDERSDEEVEITVLRHDENRGANAARNTGIERAKGRFIGFLDDDDEWRPTKIERQIVVFDEVDDDVGVVYTGIEVDRGAKKTYNAATKEGVLTRELLKRNVVGTFSTVLVRRSVINRAGTLDDQFPSWQDWEWYVRLSQHCEFKAVDELLVVRHMDGNGHLSNNFEQLSTKTYPLFVEKFDPLARSFGWRYYRQWRSVCAQNVAGYALRMGRRAEARTYITEAIRWYPLWHRPYLLIVRALLKE